jgi:flagellar biosynthesis protein FliQ
VKDIKTPELVVAAAAAAAVVAIGVIIGIVTVIVGGMTQNHQQTLSHVIWLCIQYIM